MKKLSLFFALALTAVPLAGCNINCLEGEGPEVTITRQAGEFHQVELDIPAIVTIRKGQTSIVLHGQDNILREIETDTRSGKLDIHMKGCFKNETTIRIDITTPDLQGVELNGSGSVVVVDTFQVKEFAARLRGSGKISACIIAASARTEVQGSGTVVLTGSANELETEISGSGSIRASGLPCNTTEATIRGSGEIYLYTLEKITADIAGSGVVHYRGPARVSSDISGSGTVVSEN